MTWRLVSFDIDGTLTRGHGWRFVAEATGQSAAFEATNGRFHRGEIGEAEHLTNLLNLAAGRTPEEVLDLVRRAPKIGGIRPTVAALHHAGCRTALLSHNPEYVCRWYATEFGFDDFEGTAGTRIEGDRIQPYPIARPDKVAGLGRLLERARTEPRRAAHVGDGQADLAVFARVGAGVALNAELPEVRSRADLALDSDDLRDLLDPLSRLVARRA